MRSCLDWSIAHALDLKADSLAAFVKLDGPCLALDSYYGARLLRPLIHGRLGEREHIVRGDGQEGAIQGLLEISIVA
jgi:hypothetical protein